MLHVDCNLESHGFVKSDTYVNSFTKESKFVHDNYSGFKESKLSQRTVPWAWGTLIYHF